MTREEIVAELALLATLIARRRDLNHAFGVAELKQLKRRRELLKAELNRMENSNDLMPRS